MGRVFFLELHALDALLDVDGRPLGERPTPQTRARGIAFELRRCPYAGSRHHHARPMNVSALAQMTSHWEAALTSLAAIRAALHLPAQPRVHQLLELCAVAAFKPVALWRRGLDVVDVETAVVHKIVVGMQSALHALLLRDGDVPLSSQRFYAAVEAHGALIGDDEVCAGPPHLIREVLDVVVDGTTAVGPGVDDDVLHTGRLGCAVQHAAMLFSACMAREWRALQVGGAAQRVKTRLARRTRPPLARAVFKDRRDLRTLLLGVTHLTDTHAHLSAMLDPSTRGLPTIPGLPPSWHEPVMRSLAIERHFLTWLMELEQRAPPSVRGGVKVPEGLHLSAWLGPMPRDVVEQALGLTLQNTARGLFILE